MSEDSSQPILAVNEISKSFPGVKALNRVGLHIQRGEILAVIGENGAGKSTLMKILAGIQSADSGQIFFEGKAVQLRSPKAAQDLGIALIHQELNLCDNLNIADNVFLGREANRSGFLVRSDSNSQTKSLLSQVGLELPPQTPVNQLSIGHQQLVEIAKALSIDAKVLIMDEPTSSLTSGEVEKLFTVIRELRNKGVSIIYISHRLREVIELADRVSVLRDGENAGELSKAKNEISHDAMVRMMVGREVSQFYARKQHETGEVVLRVKDLQTQAWPQEKNSLEIREGEIVGVAGLVGAGRTEMLNCLFGIDRTVSGEIQVGENSVAIRGPREAINLGLALVPEDRKQDGAMLDWPVRQNISLPQLNERFSRNGFIRQRQENQQAQTEIERLGIRTSGPSQLVGQLSGGNQQKVVIGKWLATEPKVLLLDEPTRGIDVGAKQEIYRLMEKLAGQGMAVLFVSSEMEEIIGMSDRVLVMHEGKITGQLMRSELNEERIMHLATTHEPAISQS